MSNGIHPSPQPSPQHPSMAPEDPAQQPDAKRSMKVVIRRLPHSLQRLQQQNGRLGEPAIESPAGQPVIRTKQEKREDLERAREQDRIKQQQASGEKLKELLHRKEQVRPGIKPCAGLCSQELFWVSWMCGVHGLCQAFFLSRGGVLQSKYSQRCPQHG